VTNIYTIDPINEILWNDYAEEISAEVEFEELDSSPENYPGMFWDEDTCCYYDPATRESDCPEEDMTFDEMPKLHECPFCDGGVFPITCKSCKEVCIMQQYASKEPCFSTETGEFLF